MSNKVISSEKQSFKVGKDTYHIKVELYKKQTRAQSSTNFLVNGKKYTVNWSHKYIEGPGASWSINSFHSKGLYSFYKILKRRGFQKRADQLLKVIESRFARIGFYVYGRSKKTLFEKESAKVITFLKRKKVSFIHTVQDYRNRGEETQRCLIHFDRSELSKLLDKRTLEELNLEYAESVKPFTVNGFTFQDLDRGENNFFYFIYWAQSFNVHYEKGVQTKKTESCGCAEFRTVDNSQNAHSDNLKKI